jgi:hypothetical protein
MARQRNHYTDDISTALIVIQTESRGQILRELEVSEDGTLIAEDRNSPHGWVVEGIGDWEAFQYFKFEPDGLVLFFPSYQVASYADRSFVVRIPYEKIAGLMPKVFVDALGLCHIVDQLLIEQQQLSPEKTSQKQSR